jgi:transketolase C-terminal domain/subunit
LVHLGTEELLANMHTIKVLDPAAVLRAAPEARGIVTAEEHHQVGGFGLPDEP